MQHSHSDHEVPDSTPPSSDPTPAESNDAAPSTPKPARAPRKPKAPADSDAGDAGSQDGSADASDASDPSDGNANDDANAGEGDGAPKKRRRRSRRRKDRSGDGVQADGVAQPVTDGAAAPQAASASADSAAPAAAAPARSDRGGRGESRSGGGRSEGRSGGRGESRGGESRGGDRGGRGDNRGGGRGDSRGGSRDRDNRFMQEDEPADSERAVSSLPEQTAKPDMGDWQPPEIPVVEGKLRFVDLDVPLEIIRATVDLGFQYATPVQQHSLPHCLSGRDITGRAQTGTGKTAAFLIAALTHIHRNPLEHRRPGTVRCLVLAPTRELALQIGKDATDLSKYLGLHNVVVFGGMNHRGQRDSLQTPVDVLAGTPGRILDYLSTGHLDFSQVEILVIDEADRMLDMGFIPDVRRIVARTPNAGKRQTMLYSATLDQSIMRLASRWLHEPQICEIEPEQVTSINIEEIFYMVTEDEKLNVLLWMLKNDGVERMMVFANRKDATARLTHILRCHDISAELLSGDVPQEKRLKVLERFRSGATQVVVATDVAARGIHVDNVSHVINYDLPYEPEDYVHRVGRTGRAGEKGKAISFADEYGAYLIMDLEKLIEREIRCIQPDEEMVATPPPPSQPIGNFRTEKPPGRHGNRGSAKRSRPRW